MPLTTNVLDGGIAFNEWHTSSTVNDYNGDGVAGSGTEAYVEFVNIGPGPIDISGYRYFHTVSDVATLAHTVPPGTTLAPGESYTIISNNAALNAPGPSNVSGQAAVADVVMTQSGAVNLFLVDTAGNFIVLQSPGGEDFLSDDITSISLNPANQQGLDAISTPGPENSIGRLPDGEDTFVVQTPSPGDPNCFLAGTLIATPGGAVAVEDLKVGDLILTADGGTVAVRWVGRQEVSSRFGPAGRLMPVRILAGALGEGLPLRDLTLTADHALMIDGVLVNAGALVNGETVIEVPPTEFGEGYTVYHVETVDHRVILAEGAPAETYIDYVGRRAFANYAEYVALYGEDRVIPEMAEARITSARQLPPAIRARLARVRAA